MIAKNHLMLDACGSTLRRPVSQQVSQQVSWWSVHEFVTARLRHIEYWPLIGTPAWCELSDDDPVQQAAILDAAQHWALRVETNQQAQAAAAKAIAGAADWPAVAREIRCREDFYTTHPWLKRMTS